MMRLDRGPSLQKHELVFVVIALIQLEGLAPVRRPTDVSSLRQKCTYLDGAARQGFEVDDNVNRHGSLRVGTGRQKRA